MTTDELEAKREAKRIYMRQRRADPAVRERDRQYQRDYYAKNSEVVRSKRIETYHTRTGEQERADRRAYSQRPEAKVKAAEYARQYRRKNPVLARAYQWRKKGAPTTERVYAEILLNDPCSYCGSRAGEIDHIQAVSRGGHSEWDNLTSACSFCNRSKKNRPLMVWLLNRNN